MAFCQSFLTNFHLKELLCSTFSCQIPTDSRSGWCMSMSQQLIDLSASLSLTPFHGWHHCSPSWASHPPFLFTLLAPILAPLPFYFFVSLWFIFAVPSFLPFQKVMHTRKRHSELYHELNHSSKFHTIDRYSRDPAMSTFKVRPFPKSEMGACCTHAPRAPSAQPLNPTPLTAFNQMLTCAQIKIAIYYQHLRGFPFTCICSFQTIIVMTIQYNYDMSNCQSVLLKKVTIICLLSRRIAAFEIYKYWSHYWGSLDVVDNGICVSIANWFIQRCTYHNTVVNQTLTTSQM